MNAPNVLWGDDGQPGVTPGARHRRAASLALKVDEAVLWPESVRSQVKTGSDREIVTFYPFRSSCPKSVWTELIRKAQSELYFAGYTNYFLWLEQPHFGRTLQRKAAQGCRVRFLVGDPESEITRHREEIEKVSLSVSTRIRVTLDELTKIEGSFEGKFSDDHIALSVFRFDDQMLVSLHLADLVGHDSPTLHLKRKQDDGPFDRFLYHAEKLWDAGRAMTGGTP